VGVAGPCRPGGPAGEGASFLAAGEIRALAAAGLRAHDALAAGSWAARAYLGLPGLAEGAPADAVVYDSDPRVGLGQLDHPRAVILRGELRARR
jgi:imidazolonepropionase-like amidohydrolase